MQLQQVSIDQDPERMTWIDDILSATNGDVDFLTRVFQNQRETESTNSQKYFVRAS